MVGAIAFHEHGAKEWWLLRVPAAEGVRVQGDQRALWDAPSSKSPSLRRKDIGGAHPPCGEAFSGQPLQLTQHVLYSLALFSPCTLRTAAPQGQGSWSVFFSPRPEVAITWPGIGGAKTIC